MHRKLPYIEKELLTRNICAACQALFDCKDYRIIRDIEFYEQYNFDNSTIQVRLKIYFKPINFINKIVECTITSSENSNTIYKMIKNAIDEKYDEYRINKRETAYLSMQSLNYCAEAIRQLVMVE